MAVAQLFKARIDIVVSIIRRQQADEIDKKQPGQRAERRLIMLCLLGVFPGNCRLSQIPPAASSSAHAQISTVLRACLRPKISLMVSKKAKERGKIRMPQGCSPLNTQMVLGERGMAISSDDTNSVSSTMKMVNSL
ncbi:hypothetical protein SODG_001943 [Sodalis praecaptivus]